MLDQRERGATLTGSASRPWGGGTLTSAIQARLGWRLTGGQLDFENCAATGNLIDDLPIAGNSESRPEVTDAISLKLDYRFGNGGALSVTTARETIRDALT